RVHSASGRRSWNCGPTAGSGATQPRPRRPGTSTWSPSAMARYPSLDDWIPCTVGGPGSNGKVVRIVIHTVGVKTDLQHVATGSRAWWEKQVTDNPGFKVSAHFTIERDGAIVQHVDTAQAAYGTGWLTTGSVHIEHAGNGQVQPLTDEQLHASAK